jgi:rubrerythrin
MEWIDFLKVMIVDEKGAIVKYKQASASATDPSLKKMFTEMMEEEKIHVQLIEDKIVQLQKKKA